MLGFLLVEEEEEGELYLELSSEKRVLISLKEEQEKLGELLLSIQIFDLVRVSNMIDFQKLEKQTTIL